MFAASASSMIPAMTSEGAAPDAVASVDRAYVRFEKLTAVRDVSFLLRPGHLLGLIGANGAGKTALLRAIAGIQPISRGCIRILGHDVAARDGEALSQLGFTPDTPAFYEGLTVREFLRFIGMGYGLTPQDTD